MRLAIEGSLLSHDFLRDGLAEIGGGTAAAPQPRRFALDRAHAAAVLGPTAGANLVFQTTAAPLAEWLGWDMPADRPTRTSAGLWSVLVRSGGHTIGMLALPWAREPATATRDVTRLALEHGLRFALATNGRVLRLVDATRPSVRGTLDFDLDRCQIDGAALSALYLLASPPTGEPPHDLVILARAIDASDRAGVQVCLSLRHGVREALVAMRGAIELAISRSGQSRRDRGRDEDALTAVYRILFLLFAEARQLVPTWHPVYRDGYTLAALRSRLETRASARGTWAALQAIARLAHAGCEIGDLHVAPFNGRLFAPAHAPLLDHLRLDDRTVSAALASLVFVDGGKDGRRRVAYEDLGVEQLGSIYEHLLDDEPATAVPDRPSQRKITGSFYTPSALTDYLVRVTLDPLVRGKTADEILSLRILDPAMGSGAFLVAACRYLALACERAHLEAGEPECDDDMRAAWRRRAAQRCLFGVDANPMAVQLAQLSLWLATLAAGRPLSFLDHHLLCGDSLIGASPADVMRQPPGRTARRRTFGPHPLEAFFDAIGEMAAALPVRLTIEGQADETAHIVREKERALDGSKLLPGVVRWRAACDAWCAAWFPDAADVRALYPALLDRALGRPSTLSRGVIASADTRVRRLAADRRCFHWPLEFPEVFLDSAGRPQPDGGFDAVIGNPPWEMLRADHGRVAANTLVRFSREAGIYHAQSRGHANQYQLFIERGLSLLRPGGRLGLLVPGGFLTDHGAADLRAELLRRHGFESLLVFDNRRAIFPIHRGVRFAAMTAVARRPLSHVACRFGIDTIDRLEHVSAESTDDFPIALTPAIVERLSGAQMAIPDLPDRRDLRLVEGLSAAHPALAESRGWNATFGRELNATDDKDCWEVAESSCRGGNSAALRHGLPVVEGKHLDPYLVHLDRVTRRAGIAAVRERLGRSAGFTRPRLAYREVAAATNRLTLIAAILPAYTISVHTVFCLRTPLAADEQDVLCALLNSYVANYLVRRWVTTHVTASIVERLPVPRPERGTRQFVDLARDASRLREGECEGDLVSRIQVRAARAYGVSADDFAYILDSFPLVPADERRAALRAFGGSPC
jgi:Eco57I restriction-modification methylase